MAKIRWVISSQPYCVPQVVQVKWGIMSAF
jgi:hypothetical protein